MITGDVVVCSENPVKFECTKLGFSQVFPGLTFNFLCGHADSEVDAQPKTDKETYQGACNRVKNIKSRFPNALLYVGLEGGVELQPNGLLYEFAWIVIDSPLLGIRGAGKTATFIAPPAFIPYVFDQGMEIGSISDLVFGETNSKQRMGAIGLLTNNVIDRIELYRHAVVNPELYKGR